MKVVIALLVLVGTTSLQANAENHRYQLMDAERYWTVSPTNTVLFTRNQSEPTQDIELKKTIDNKHELLISAEVTNKSTGKKVYSAQDLKICSPSANNYHTADTWDSFLIKFFKSGMMPEKSLFGCPIEPTQYKIHRWVGRWFVTLPYKLSDGQYEISYSIKSWAGEVVFNPLKFRFYCKEVELLQLRRK